MECTRAVVALFLVLLIDAVGIYTARTPTARGARLRRQKVLSPSSAKPGFSHLWLTADLATLTQTLQVVCDLMRHSGVGGLPLLAVPDGTPPPPLPTEDQMIAQTTRAVQVLYDQLKRGQDSAAVVANLLNSTDRPPAHR